MPLRTAARVFGLLLAVLLTLAGAVPAQAHDTLVSSTPAAGEEVPAPPEQVSLSFNASISDQFAQVAVVDAQGATYQVGDPVVDGPTVAQAVTGLEPGGAYSISYRVVSSDGHPIGGSVPFTVAPAAGQGTGGAQATPQTLPTAEPTAAATPAAGEGTSTTGSTDEVATTAAVDDDGTSSAGWLIALGLLAFVGSIVVAALVLRGRARTRS